MTDLTWSGKSGTVYGFNLHTLAATFLDVPGVYILCRAEQIGGVTRYRALYVGETQSLENRLNANRGHHDGFKRASRAGVTHIAARVVSGGAAVRLQVETDLRHRLNPQCNVEDNALLNALLRQ